MTGGPSGAERRPSSGTSGESSDAWWTDRPFLLPVGLELGPHPSRVADGEYEFHVRLGARAVGLDRVRYALWQLARDAESALPQRASVVEDAVALGLDRSTALEGVDALLADGLLAEIGDARTARRFAETHRLVPTVLGLGPTEGPARPRRAITNEDPNRPRQAIANEDPNRPRWAITSGDSAGWTVGLLDLPVAALSPSLYDLWLWAPLEPHLWSACVAAARTVRSTEASGPSCADIDDLVSNKENERSRTEESAPSRMREHERSDDEENERSGHDEDEAPHEVLRDVLAHVHPLLVCGAACLDLADPAGERLASQVGVTAKASA